MRSITNNCRSDDQFSIMHLFEFDMYTLAGAFQETLYFTDFDIFVKYGANEYTPLAITFDSLKEDVTMQSNSINVAIDNVSGALTQEAFTSEWRNNPARITRIVFTPPSETPGDGETYPFGYGDNLDVYPKIDLTSITKDVYLIFSGIIDTFSATEQTLTATVTTQFSHWKKPVPNRTYSQDEFNSIILAMSESVYWGKVKDV